MDQNPLQPNPSQPNPSQPKILDVGIGLFEKYDLKQYRRPFSFNFSDEVDWLEAKIKHFMKNDLGITDEQIDRSIIIKKTIEKPGLKWHIDDCQFITRKTAPEYDTEKFIQINGNRYLYFSTKFNKLPDKTILFYTSTIGKDFDGGILRLCDGTEIHPVKGTGFMFDSREVHMVTPVKWGTRGVILVKLY